MATIIEPSRSTSPARLAPTLQAFLELAFRPLYLAGTGWAAIAIGIWIYAPQILTAPLHGIAWHAHEMLWGFIATIAVGFLMTAGANWTGINPLHGGTLAIACLLWLLARGGFLVNGDAWFWIATAAELAFFLLAAIAMMCAVYRARNKRNYAVPWLLVALGATDLLFLLAARSGDYLLLMQRFHAGLMVMAMIALLIARRVIPFFAMRAVPGLAIPMQTRIGHVQLVACAAAVIFVLADLAMPAAITITTAAVLALLQLVRWKPMSVRRHPLLWILYVGYAGLGVGLLAAACASAGLQEVPRALSIHMTAMAGFSVLIVGMVTRTALGHLGRPLAVDRSILSSYVLVLLAVALRLAALVPAEASAFALYLAATAWIAAWALYIGRFASLLVRPRM